jgi:alpha-glucoside transport system permease protein
VALQTETAPDSSTKRTSTGQEMKPASSMLGIVVVGGTSLVLIFAILVLYPLKDWWHKTWFFSMLFKPVTAMQKITVGILAIVLFVAVMGVILWLIDRPKVPNFVLLAGFLGPVVVFLAVGLLWPAIRTILDSFHKFRQGNAVGWTGFENYTYYFHGGQSKMFINTVLWVFLVPICATVFGLVYAVLVDRTRFEKAAKALIFLPTAISMVAASVIWRYVYYQPGFGSKGQIGLLNGIVTAFGGTPKNWLILSFPSPTFALIVIMIWIQAGFAMTVLSAAIKAIPDDIIEAAAIDSATGIRLFRYITIPSIRPTLVVVITTVAIGALKTFDIVLVMVGTSAPNAILASGFYGALSNLEYGRAGALAVMIFVIVSPIIIFNVRQMKKSEGIR